MSSTENDASLGEFVPLHCHSEYSSLDGGAKVNDIPERLKELGFKAMALTDHGVMQGLPHFQEKLRSEGIKPILGIEAYLTNDRHDHSRGTPTWHITLLAETQKGYQNLCKLSTWAFLEGRIMTFNRARARADWELMDRYSEGVICLSGCMAGPVMGAIMIDGDLSKARKYLNKLIEIFGRENVYGEIQNAGVEEHVPEGSELARKLGRVEISQTDGNRELAEICAELEIPLVATGDSHYLRPEDAEPHDVMLCIGTGQKKRGERRFSLLPKLYHMRSLEEMREAVGEWPEAISNTVKIAERCSAEIQWEKNLLPRYELPEGFDEARDYLRHLCERGLEERYPEGDEYREEALERLDFELGVIDRMGYNDYFLITWDLFNEAERRDIPAGPGRGSAAGSLVAYTLDITKMCPLKYKLLFERFLNPDRISPPDIDMDFATAYNGGRDALMEYSFDKYNKQSGSQTAVAQQVTFSRFKAKGALKDSARALAEPTDDGAREALKLGDRLAAMIPDDPKATISSVLADEREGKRLKLAKEGGGIEAEIVNQAAWLEDMIRAYSTHAAAVLIADHDLSDDLPLQQLNSKKPLEIQYEMGHAERIGLLKMDFLVIRNLDVIWDACRKIKHTRGIEIKPYRDIPLTDTPTYETFARGESIGTFQFESGGMSSALREVRPTEFEDLVALVALYRPGPMAHIPTYAARKHGKEPVSYLDPRLEPIQKDSYGLTLYQETSMMIARELAGFTPGQADDLRKAIGKKQHDRMEKLKPMFIKGCEENDVAKEVAEALWADNEAAADYSFNRCAASDTRVILPDGERIRLSEAYRIQPEEIMSMWEDGEIRPHKISKIVRTGRKELFRVRCESGRQIKVTADHRLLTTEGYKKVSEMAVETTELITTPMISDRQRKARSETMRRLAASPARKEQDKRASKRMRAYQANRSMEDKVAHMKKMHELHPHISRVWMAAAQERIKWLYANDPEWKARQVARTLASVKATRATGPGYGHCSIASNGMWCASKGERAMCEWLIDAGVDFEIHKTLANGRICDFYFSGVYWEMDGMDRSDDYWEEKYKKLGLPYVVVTPEDFKQRVSKVLDGEIAQAENGDRIISIEPIGEGPTYDIEMSADGPLNFIANGIVSHNSHAVCYAYLAYITGYLKTNYPEEYMAALLSSVVGKKDKPAEYLREAKRMGLRVLPPDVNRSLSDFAVMERPADERDPDGPEEQFDILFGMEALRGVGGGVVSEIVAEREARGPFSSMYDLIRRLPKLTKTVIQALIKGGALDSTGDSRKGMFDQSEDALERIRKEIKDKEKELLKTARESALELTGEKLSSLERKGFDGGVKALAPPKDPDQVSDEELSEAISDALLKGQMTEERAKIKKLLADNPADVEVAGIAAEEGADASDVRKVVEAKATENVEGSERRQERDELTKVLVELTRKAVKKTAEDTAEEAGFEEAMAEESDPVILRGEWPEKEKLNLERQMLGIYVSGHPLDEIRRQWAWSVDRGIGQLTDQDITPRDAKGAQLPNIGGVLVGLEKREIRSGVMYKAVLEDLTGAREITIWPDTAKGKEEILEIGEILSFKVQIHEDTFAAQKAEEDEEGGDGDESGKPIQLIASSFARWDPTKSVRVRPRAELQEYLGMSAQDTPPEELEEAVKAAEVAQREMLEAAKSGEAVKSPEERRIVPRKPARRASAQPFVIPVHPEQRSDPEWKKTLQEILDRHASDDGVTVRMMEVKTKKIFATPFKVTVTEELKVEIKTLYEDKAGD